MVGPQELSPVDQVWQRESTIDAFRGAGIGLLRDGEPEGSDFPQRESGSLLLIGGGWRGRSGDGDGDGDGEQEFSA